VKRRFFITRAKRNLDARRVYSAPVDRDTGLICDQTIALNGFYAAEHYHVAARGEVSLKRFLRCSLITNHPNGRRVSVHWFEGVLQSLCSLS